MKSCTGFWVSLTVSLLSHGWVMLVWVMVWRLNHLFSLALLQEYPKPYKCWNNYLGRFLFTFNMRQYTIVWYALESSSRILEEYVGICQYRQILLYVLKISLSPKTFSDDSTIMLELWFTLAPWAFPNSHWNVQKYRDDPWLPVKPSDFIILS